MPFIISWLIEKHERVLLSLAPLQRFHLREAAALFALGVEITCPGAFDALAVQVTCALIRNVLHGLSDGSYLSGRADSDLWTFFEGRWAFRNLHHHFLALSAADLGDEVVRTRLIKEDGLIIIGLQDGPGEVTIL